MSRPNTHAGNKMLLSLSEKLKVDVNSLQKAEEYYRAFRDKATGRFIDDCTKAVLCLDLAVTTGGSMLEEETALKLTGLKKAKYKANLKMLEKLLNLDKPLVVSELCVQLGCSEVKDLAEQILAKYKEDDLTGGLDHPMYVTAAVSGACRLERVKVPKAKFLEASSLKSKQWNELEAKFRSCVDCVKAQREEIGKAPTFADYLGQESQNASEQMNRSRSVDEDDLEDYESWKERTLSEARAALQKEMEDAMRS